MEKNLWFYGKNYGSIPKTLEFDLLWKKAIYGTMEKTIVQ